MGCFVQLGLWLLNVSVRACNWVFDVEDYFDDVCLWSFKGKSTWLCVNHFRVVILKGLNISILIKSVWFSHTPPPIKPFWCRQRGKWRPHFTDQLNPVKSHNFRTLSNIFCSFLLLASQMRISVDVFRIRNQARFSFVWWIWHRWFKYLVFSSVVIALRLN